MVHKFVLYLLNCALFSIFCLKKLYTKIKRQTTKFLHEVGRTWTTEKRNTTEFSSDDTYHPVSEPTPWGPKEDLSGRLSGDFNKQGEKKYPERQCRIICAVHKGFNGMI
jgi:hypothetical protein